ncbi:retention module-containing protein [Pseudomonas sp. dw_358]|uniref:retention module-containing protein n=1 Tax=Pseudomonas sp. dw_358 TaxID=2720083 RepID=UPI001BD44C53|nr:retention module-containing protein [Pseudomonas sp. dw_358]
MAQLIGVVSKVVGTVIAVAANGGRRVLVEGDRLYAGDVLETGTSGAVAVHLQNGQDMMLGRDSTVHLSEQTLATNVVPHVEIVAEGTAPNASPLIDVERIQAAIAAGQDPSVDADPTAAGTTPAVATGTAAGGGHSFVLLEAVGGAVAPTVGLDTAGVTSTAATASLFVNSLVSTTAVTVSTSTLNGINEANLADGSNPLASALTQTGSFTVTATNGLSNLSVAGTAILTNGVLVGLNQAITTALGNSITITGLDASAGTVNYSYTLLTNEAHAAGNGTNNLAESIGIVASNAAGATGTGNIVVNITDDVPTAVNDLNDDGVDQNAGSVTGDVLDNDIQGADVIASGPITAGTFTGIYGTLVLAVDGSYTYTVNPNAPAFIALGHGGSGVDTFTYTLNDSDGDTSTATLSVDVNNADTITISNSTVTVNEANLALGSTPSTAALTQNASFVVAASAGLSDLSINGVDVVSGGAVVGANQPIALSSGDTITVTGVNLTTGLVSYAYTLNQAYSQASGGGANSLVLGISVVAIDNEGNAVSNAINVNITDDVPRAVADSNSGVATATSTTLTGNVLTNDIQGADRISTGPVTAGSFSGTYGTLALNADGTYTYTLNPSDPDFITLGAGGRGTETFTYTLNDADGDTSTATLTLNVANGTSSSTISIAQAGSAPTVNEANLALGSSPNAAALTQTGNFTVTASAGLNSLSINGVAILTNGTLVALNQPITTALGNTVTVTGLNALTGAVTYTYTLNRSETHASGNSTNNLTETLSIIATDKANVSASGSLTVNITDDVPRAVNDTGSTSADASHLTLTGSVLTNDTQGADRISTGPVTAATLTGTYGTLVLNSAGNYIYTLNTSDTDYIALGSRTGTETFRYTLNDADGDTSTATLTLTVAGAPGSVVISGLGATGGDVNVKEASLALGSAPNASALTQTDTFVVTASNGFASLSVAGVSILNNGVLTGLNQPITTALGNILTVTGLDATTGLVTYTYKLSGATNVTGTGNNVSSENIAVVATDSSGTSSTATIVAQVTDDVPTAVNDTNTTSADATHLTLTGNVLTNDVQGADRIASGPITAGSFTGTYGTLVLTATGTYTYTLNTADPDYVALGSGTGTETFTYTLKDSDGDTSTATLILNVAGNGGGTITIGGIGNAAGDVTVNEANLALGSSPNAAALTQTGTFTVNTAAGLSNLTIAGVTVLLNGNLVNYGTPITTASGNRLLVTGLNATTGVVTYSYTLTGAETHPTGNGANTLTENLAVTATDRAGAFGSGTLVAHVTDDVPRAVNDTGPSALDATHLTLTGNVLTNDVQGADRIAGGPITSGTFTGVYGSLVLAANGAYTYTLNTADPDYIALGSRTGTETFTYTLKDADGDTSTATLTLNVNGTTGSISIIGIGSNDVSVNEANLALGSSPNPAALSQTHTFTVNATAGLSNLSVGGVAILTNGTLVGLNQAITTTLGNTITVTSLDATTGSVTYTYKLTGNNASAVVAGANTVSENILVTASDSTGAATSGNIVANVIDDVPKAVNDTGASNLDATHLTLTGNVLSNDTQGADRITSGPVTAFTQTGTYGTLILNSSGVYTYTLNTNSSAYLALGNHTGTETFTYTLKDSDGDTSTATLTLTVAGQTGTITFSGIGSNDVTVNEANLALGSAPNASALTQTHTFTVNATAGLASLSVAGVTILNNGSLVALNQPITTALGNTLTITGLDATTGLVTYTYQLTGNNASVVAAGANTVSENLAVVATDRAGTSATGSIVANVIDDVPRAVNDTNATNADATHLTLTGNVLTNDIQGADRIGSGPITAGTFTGTYGTLVLTATGGYTYTLNTSDPDYTGLGSRTGTETFTYTLKDSDGDTSTATLTLNVTGTGTLTIGGIGNSAGDVTVTEANLALGSAPNAAALTQSGTFTVNTTAGLSNLSIAGVTVLSNGNLVNYGTPITTALGNTLRITGLNATTGTITYTYTLTGNEAHPTGLGANVLTESLAVAATDRAGSSGSSTIVVKVTDDVPTAVNDTSATTADATHLTLTGNVLTNDIQGADRVSGGPVQAGTFVGTYGTLVVSTSGAYTYTLNTSDPDYLALAGGGRGTETFSYTIKDSDGDTSSANLVLNVGGAASTVTIVGIGNSAGDVSVNEANLSLGSSPNSAALTKSGSFTVTTSAGLYNLSIGGVAVLTNGTLINYGAPITTASGNTLRITGLNASTGLISYTYTLTANEAHPSGQGTNTLTETLAVVAGDRAGATGTSSLVATVVDDVPTAFNDSNSTAATATHLTLTGNVLTNDIQGADRVSSGPVLGGTFTGTYGTLVLSSTGAYTYTLDTRDADFLRLANGAAATETFTYTLKDSDGDTSSAVLTLNVTGDTSSIVIGGFGSTPVTVNEANLALGSAPNASALTQTATFTVTASAGLTSLSVGGVAILTNGVLVGLNQAITTSLGNTITVTGLNATTGLVTYSYHLTGNDANVVAAGANTVSESIAVSATDATGNTATSSITANVIDDVPKAVNDTNASVADETHLTLTGNVLTNDTQGADRITTGPITAGTYVGTYGSLVLAADGSYTYTLNPNSANFVALLGGASATERFTYTLNDSDGDTSTATLTLNISNANDPVTLGGLAVPGGEVTVYEANLATGSSPDAAGLTRTGSFTVSAPDGLANLTINSVALITNGVLATSLPTITGALGNTLTITGYNAITGVVSYAYHLNGTETQAAGASSIVENFTVAAADRDGSSTTGVLNVNIINDAPIAVNDVNGSLLSAANQTATGNVLTNDVLGADRVTGGPVVSGTYTGTYGTLVLAANGAYTYTLNTSDVDFKALSTGQFVTDKFSYTLRDADGDTSSAQLSLQITGGAAATTVTLFRTLVVADDTQTAATNSSDFTASTLQTIAFSGASTQLAESIRSLDRAEFTALSGGMAAALLVTGYLAATAAAGQVDQESFSVSLKQGETLTVDTAMASQLGLQLVLADGSTQTLTADHAFTATQDGTYTLHVSNTGTAAENYSLGLTIGPTTAIYASDTATGTATDAHYSTADTTTATAATLTAATTGDHVLVGTDGNDTLTAGSGNDSLFGGKGDDLLIAGSGNDLLNGGEGNNTVSFQNATAGVHVSLAIVGQQNTVGAGYDTLVSIQNLVGSSHDDVLIGNDSGNVLNGGLGNDTLVGGKGNDTLIGGPGNNTLTGGGGNDSFLYEQGNVGHDTVTDFKPGSNTLDLSQLLQGHTDTNSLDDYLHFKVTGTGDNLVSTIEVSSSAAATPTQTIDLQGVNLATQYGVAPGASGVVASNDAATIIHGMLTDHSLKVDTV